MARGSRFSRRPSSRPTRPAAGRGTWRAGTATRTRSTHGSLVSRSRSRAPTPIAWRTSRARGLWLAVGANELVRGTIYNSLLLYSPAGELVLHHRKLMPTNHERLVWGLGDGTGLEAIQSDIGRVGGLICWENLMPLARFALYQSGVEVYLAPTADDSEAWHDSIRHIAREARAFVISSCFFQRASSYPDYVPLADGDELVGRGGSAILGPEGSYLAGPLWDEEGILYAELDPQRLYEARQRFDPAGHYHRPDVFRFELPTQAVASLPT